MTYGEPHGFRRMCIVSSAPNRVLLGVLQRNTINALLSDSLAHELTEAEMSHNVLPVSLRPQRASDVIGTYS